jgi:alpha-1,3-mannosyl-glycoprotein beta-1,2-N-acetylglucosaminyltransferase
LSDIEFDKNKKKIPAHLKGYYKISRHYKWALEKVFMEYKFQTVILTEDDLNISPDFFDYFDTTQKVIIIFIIIIFIIINIIIIIIIIIFTKILARDPSLFCVSAWNDNGKSNLINWNKPGIQ